MKKIFTSVFILLFLWMNSQNITFEDPSFKWLLVFSADTAKDLNGNFFKIDTNNDGEISLSEASFVSYIDVHLGGITSLEGIRNFTNLSELFVTTGASEGIPTIDLHQMPSLKYFSYGGNTLQSLNMQGNTGLLELEIQDTFHLTGIDLSSCIELQKVKFSRTTITSLNLKNLIALKEVNCSENYNLSSVQLSGSTNLENLEISNSILTDIDLTGLSKLNTVKLSINNFTTLNLQDQNQLTFLNVWQNFDLTSLYIKNGANEVVNFQDTPNLQYICSDANQITDLLNTIGTDYGGNPSTVVDASCGAVLNSSENNLGKAVIIYPNPVIDVLGITTKNKIQSVEIFDSAGRLVFSTISPKNTINISHLKSGVYLVSIKSENKKRNKQIIKK